MKAEDTGALASREVDVVLSIIESDYPASILQIQCRRIESALNHEIDGIVTVILQSPASFEIRFCGAVVQEEPGWNSDRCKIPIQVDVYGKSPEIICRVDIGDEVF